MLRIKLLLLVLLSILWMSCEKKLNIADFKDEFGNYQPELKVEGLLRLERPEHSIIRIIRSSRITDNDLYNKKDDDGDGIIDEYDEVVALVQDTSATVTVTNLNSGVEIEFHYVAVADSAVHYEEDDDDHETEVMVPYGGYKPVSTDFQLEAYAEYKLEIYSGEFNKTITAVTTVYPQVEFIDTLYAFNGDIVTVTASDKKEFFWKSDKQVTAYYITSEELESIDNPSGNSDFINSYAQTRDNDLTKKYRDVSVGSGAIWWVAGSDIVLRYTVEALSPDYGRYIFSDLPLNDPQRSNLRDENGNPVMGCFGAIAAKSIYVVIK